MGLDHSSTLDFGTASSTLSFAASTAYLWTGTLTITNYTVGSDSLRFGDSASGLNLTQLGQISFAGFTSGAADASGYVTPVPEPANYAAFAGLGALVFATWRRRNRKSAAFVARTH